MFAVKSEYCIQLSRGITIPFYVADDELYFKDSDIINEIYGSIFYLFSPRSFDNFDGCFVKSNQVFRLFYSQTEQLVHHDLWRDIVNQDYSKVIAEVRDAQHFCKEYFKLDLPEDWSRLKIDAIIADLPGKATEWIEKCHDSLRILATNYEQHKAARRVYDEAWKILKIRKKDDARPTVREVLNKYGLTCDALIQAVLAAYKSKFDSQYSELESELTRLFN